MWCCSTKLSSVISCTRSDIEPETAFSELVPAPAALLKKSASPSVADSANANTFTLPSSVSRSFNMILVAAHGSKAFTAICFVASFALIKDMPYRLGKLSHGSIEFYDEWHFELDRFFENNYVLVRKGFSLERLGQTVYFDASNCPVAVVKTQ